MSEIGDPPHARLHQLHPTRTDAMVPGRIIHLERVEMVGDEARPAACHAAIVAGFRAGGQILVSELNPISGTHEWAWLTINGGGWHWPPTCTYEWPTWESEADGDLRRPG